jgi:hypothetical protein
VYISRITLSFAPAFKNLFSTLLVGGLLVAGPVLAQQNPWVPGGMYTGSLANGQASQRHYKDRREAQGSASFIRMPGPPAPPEAMFHAISPMP